MQNARILLFFSIATIIGTLAHECGHYIAGLLSGFDPSVHYMYTGCDNCSDLLEQAEQNGTIAAYRENRRIFNWGGPLQTMLTGIAGLIGLMFISRKEEIDAFRPKHLLWITIAYFWSRELVLSASLLINYFFYYRMGSRSDEYRLFTTGANKLLPGLTVLFFLSGLILAWVTFGMVKKHRIQLIVFGAIGCAITYPLWMYWLGPLILP